ncbi:MAG TPA: sel1 repeat family protein [Chlorobaculum sp.]|uniref:Sel1 repeat family protein n=1 Tax=Chlorobaculum tepidum (strain ATCC 49652 / DSM 12025 / NBRC 103806 / TLS) TaxID=194439 RepID=Q8KBJ4_CHLTE|nr:SEL1-like repeat protein [Chlorobaculum tepidum]AAM73014.1 conserved hypothetical protein [Chlorobaculum tepidum TLS]HBU24460.1 sel1 repeat family protein [Chlorobaculum sp.]
MKKLILCVLTAFALLAPATSYCQPPSQKEFSELKKAAEQGDAQAQCMLGLMYELGLGVRQDKRTAKEWYGKACDNGNQKGCDNYRRLNELGY